MRSPEEIGKIILQLKGEMSLRDFAQKCDISHTTIDNLIKGKDFRTKKPTQPKVATIKKIAEACGVSISYIIGEEETSTSTPFPTNIHPVKSKKFPILGEIACGKPIFADENHESYISASSEIKADWCLVARGDSMIGARIHDGDIVFIHEQSIVENGEIAAVIIGDEATLKRWYYYPDKEKLVLNAENPAYEPLVYTGEELNEIRCLGKAVCFMSNL